MGTTSEVAEKLYFKQALEAPDFSRATRLVSLRGASAPEVELFMERDAYPSWKMLFQSEPQRLKPQPERLLWHD